MNEIEKGNVVYSCKEHGVDLYHAVKNNPEVPSEYIYCVFPKAPDGVTEKMWVLITDGDRNKGVGTVQNVPAHAEFSLDERVSFYTNEEDVTYANKITN